MSKRSAVLLFVLLGILAGCGDNARDCGPGTIQRGGQCVPDATCGFGTHQDPETLQCVADATACSPGTVFDPVTGTCMLDPSACQNGTVLIDGACVDPAAGLVIDAEEGPEPNGLGIIEASEAQAGNITLKGEGNGAFVVHGTLAPARDDDGDGALDPDVDTYVLTIAAPAFIRITADGVGGTQAGFVAVAQVDATDDVLADWRRVGLSLVTDTSIREVFLPRPGTYRLAIADTRTLLEYLSTGDPTAAPGGATAEYYVSLSQEAVPTATALTVSGGTATVSATLAPDQQAVYSVPLGTGLNRIALAMPSELATGAFVVMRDDTVVASASESGSAQAIVGDVMPGELIRIIVDDEYALSPAPQSFTLDASVSNAVALSTSGGTVMAPVTATNGSNLYKLSLLSFDVASDASTLGITLTLSPAVVGEIYDASGTRAAAFTPPTSGVTWTTYRGLLRFASAGRYYLAVYAPSAMIGASISATSTIVHLLPTVVTESMPLNVPVGVFRSVPFTYDPVADWQQFDVTGSNTGGQVASWFDPSIAFGRLDPLTTSAGTVGPEIPPIFTKTFPASGGAFGRVVLSDGTPTYYVTVRAVNPVGSPTTTLTFAPRAGFVDLGTVTSGSVSATAQTLAPGATQRWFLVRTVPGKSVTITVTPTSAVNTQFRRLNADETPLGALVNTSSNGADVETFTQGATGWTAFVVSSAGSLSASRTFDVSVSVQ